MTFSETLRVVAEGCSGDWFEKGLLALLEDMAIW